MKKILVSILFIIYGLTFYTYFNEMNVKEYTNVSGIESKLEHSYQILLPLEVSNKSKEDVYSIIKEKLDMYNLNLFINKNTDGVLIKYIYLNDFTYKNEYVLREGRFFEKEDFETLNFISSNTSDDVKQIGVISEFAGDDKIEVRTLKNIIESNNAFSGTCIIQGENIKIDEFLNELKLELSISSNINLVDNDAKNNINLGKGIDKFLPIVYLIIFIIILYDILKHNKAIGIQRLNGYTFKDIWLIKIKELLFIQLIVILVTITILSVIMFKSINMYTIKFIINVIIKYIYNLLLVLIASTIPFICLGTVNTAQLIKNKGINKQIIIFNILFKVIISIILVISTISAFDKYNNLKKFYNDNFEVWNEAEKYQCIANSSIPISFSTEYEFLEKNKELYDYLNEKGAILADFNNYTVDFQKANLVSEDRRFEVDNILVNPNYLESNPVYDINNNRVYISEENKSNILLVPEEYMYKEEEIKNYFKKIYTGYSNPKWVNNDIKIEIIWINNDTRLFSYNIEVNADEYNFVRKPIISILTENNAPLPEYDRIIGYVGNPLKAYKEDKNILEEKLDENFYSLENKKYKYTLINADDPIAIKVNKLQRELRYSIVSIGILITILLIVIVNNIYTYFNQYRKKIFIKKFNGYNYIDKYIDFYSYLIFSNVIIFIITMFIVNNKVNAILIISLFNLILELIISIIIFKYLENSTITTEIKKG